MREPDDAAQANAPRDNPAHGSAQQIAAALARLRGPRPGGPPRGEGGFGRFSGGPHPLHDDRRLDRSGGRAGRAGDHLAHDGRGHGPMGRFAARVRLLEALGAASTPLSVSELAESIGVDQPRASRLVQAAVEAGHARREADASDARRTNIVLTDEGRAVTLQARGARIGAVEKALGDFSLEDQARLAALLTRLAEAWPRA